MPGDIVIPSPLIRTVILIPGVRFHRAGRAWKLTVEFHLSVALERRQGLPSHRLWYGSWQFKP